MANRRFISCSFDISSEKIATVPLLRIVTYSAIFSARAVLPIEGRAAIRIRSAGCRPAVRLSRSWKPVATPVTLPLVRAASSIFAIASMTIRLTGTKSLLPRFCEISKMLFSARSRIVSRLSFSV